MLKFYLPDFYNFFNLNMNVITKLLTDSEMFMDNISIGAVYGSFPGAYWNGGRVMNGITDKQNIRATINAFNDQNVPIRFTFTNQLINKSLLYDPYCNMIMDLANNGMNEVLVNSPILEEYLRDNYPNFKYISSTTKCLTNINAINKECDDYYLTVLDYRFNPNKDFHKLLINKDKIELLINAYCSPKCTKRAKHYELLSRLQLEQGDTCSPYCNYLATSFIDCLEFPTVIKKDELYGYFVDQGFKHFKIEGRTMHIVDVLESYIYYLVKPEYQDRLRNEFLKGVMQ